MYLTETLQDKWQPVLEHPDLPKIGDAYKRAVTSADGASCPLRFWNRCRSSALAELGNLVRSRAGG